MSEKSKSLSEFKDEKPFRYEKPKVLDPAKPDKWNEEYSEEGRFRIFFARWQEVEHFIEDKSIDLIAVDPPFSETSAEWDSDIDWYELSKFYNRVLKQTGAVVIFGSERTLLKLDKEFESNGFVLHDALIRHKDNGLWTSWTKSSRFHENIFVYVRESIDKESITFNHALVGKRHEPKEQKQGATTSELVGHGLSHRKPYRNYNHPQTVIFAGSITGLNKEYEGHPTQKPLHLMRYLIKLFSNEGELVLDNFMGSASTGVACIQTKRRFIGVEAEKRFYDISLERLKRTNVSTLDGFDGQKGGDTNGTKGTEEDTAESKEGGPTQATRHPSGEEEEIEFF